MYPTTWRSRHTLALAAVLFGCGAGEVEGNPGQGGSTAVGSGGSAGTVGGATSSGGAGSGGSPTTGGTGVTAGTGAGGAGSAGTSGSAGTGVGGGATECGAVAPFVLDCGSSATPLESHGPLENRVMHVIAGDGYLASELDTLFLEHIDNAFTGEDGRWSVLGEPYARYRKFVNICALQVASNDACIDNQDIGQDCDTPFGGRCNPPCGSGGTRLGTVNRQAVEAAISDLMPANLDVDWLAVSIRGTTNGWWNSGGPIMVWNGAYEPRNRSASVALHEGGHTYHRLADEYGGTGTGNDCDAPEINVSNDNSGSKWTEWLNYNDDRAESGTGLHSAGAFEGGHYCNDGVWRPTDNSEMNQLPDGYNMVSIQKIIHDIYEIVDPIDAHTNNTAPLTNPTELEVTVIDPAVIKVDWSVDGAVVSTASGGCYTPGGLTPGQHTITARAYDDTPWVKDDRSDLEQTVSWTVNIQ